MKNMKLCVAALLCFAVLCSAVSAATLFIDPSATELNKGDSVQLAVVADDVVRLGSYDIDITWNPVLVSLSEVTAGPSIDSLEKNIQSGRVRIAGLNSTLEGLSGSGIDLCYLSFIGVGDNGESSPVAITVNNYGFLNSTSGEDIPVDAIINGSITTIVSSVVDARIGIPNRQVPVNEETLIRASVANQRTVATSPLTINVTIVKDAIIVQNQTYDDVVILPGGTFSREIAWTPATGGAYLVNLTVTSDDAVRGSPTDQKTITSIDYQLSYPDGQAYGVDRAQVDNWFYHYVRVSANKAGAVNLSIDVPDSFEIWGGSEQTAYLYNYNWNYLYIWMRSTEPGTFNGNLFNYTVSANGKSASVQGKDVTIYVPSIQVKSINSSRITSATTPVTMEFNTVHTNNTNRNVTKIVAQSGAQGRTLSGLGYLVGYPYGCVEQTTSRMLASLNVKNYYLGRADPPTNFASIRDQANNSVSTGIDKLVNGGERGQNSDGGWSLWGGDPSESSSSSYASYTLAKINKTDEDLNRLLVDKISTGDTVTYGTANFEKLIEWFHENPDDPSSGAWYWSAPVCHSWTKESNTAFVMLIHDMINQSGDVQQPYRGYMEENMQNATRYLIDNQKLNGAFSDGDDAAMATALGLWGLESFGLPSDTVTEADITDAKERAVGYLNNSQNADGSWPAGTYYGWYDNGRITESTAYAILALNATGVPNDDARISSGVGWLVDTYENSGSWGYTWASQAAIDALIVCQGSEISTGTVDVYVDGVLVHTFTMNAANPREEYTLTSAQMAAMMAGGTETRDIFGDGFSIVKSHEIESQLTAGDGPIALSVENSQWSPLNEIDSTIRNTRVIQMEGDDNSFEISQINTNIDILSEVELDVGGFSITVNSDPSPMVVNEATDVSIGVISDADLFSPMIEVPIADFSFDNTSTIRDGNGAAVSYEVLNSTANENQDSIFIQPESWVQDAPYTYTFGIVPENYGTLNMSLRIIPLYDDSNVAYTSHNFDVTGTGNVTINVQDENYVPVTADTITVGVNTVLAKSSWEFSDLLEDSYQFNVTKSGFPDVHGTVVVNYGETTVYNVTLPTTMAEPVLILSEGGSGSIAGVAQIPGELNANVAESTTYNVSVMGDGGELGVALQFPQRYLVNSPVVKLNGAVLGASEYELTPGTFVYGPGGTYTTTDATLVVYNTTSGTNYIGMEFDGDVWGDAYNDGSVNSIDSLYILHFVVGNIAGFDTYGYPDVYDRNSQTINAIDALYISHRVVGNLDEYYQ
ncbi:hypothetical protein L1S32_00890 [Methanogenium sp. S4BF]|uniref:hypothetical protein n=1 Tax=Methanogenium sp. S4BF TaxID=1789226 RepID=UPI0024173121|nr:hypothetical protein [Methanogenium sp. S4BF]WFN34710.1 hypothetical protein L1S32_00890 [Methanogenium sp. S4BF]